jgi:hypothetical protein
MGAIPDAKAKILAVDEEEPSEELPLLDSK